MSCVSLCIFPPSLVIPSPSHCHVASALTQGSQFTAESNIGVSGFSLGVLALPRSWLPGQACFLFLPWPAASGRQYPHSDATSLQPPFAGMWGPPWSHTGGLALSLPDAGYFHSLFVTRSGNGLFPPPAPSPRVPCPSSFIPTCRFLSCAFFSPLIET